LTHYAEIKQQLDKRIAECGREAQSVSLIAVSKTVGVDQVQDAIKQGAIDFGENRPEQLILKAQTFPEARWHFIGNIQSRQISRIVAYAYLIHSVCDEQHLLKIDEVAGGYQKIQDILIEVNVSGEESKSGVTPSDALALAQKACSLPHICLRGLMTMAPQGDPEAIAATFSGLAQLKTDIEASLPIEKRKAFTELSMGMSEDWTQAIAYGATMVRIGRAVFSDVF